MDDFKDAFMVLALLKKILVFLQDLLSTSSGEPYDQKELEEEEEEETGG